jgi:hypothetical protein
MDVFPDVTSGLQSRNTSYADGVVIADHMPVVWQRNNVEPDETLKATMGAANWTWLCALVRRQRRCDPKLLRRLLN